MNCNPNIRTGVGGTPYLITTNVSVSETAVNLALGFHPVPRLGDLTIRIATAIPDAPLTRSCGNFAGKTAGSLSDSS